MLQRVQFWGTVVLCLFSACLVSLVGVSRLSAQGATATIQGTVTDMSGAAIPGASVQVRNTGTGVAETTATDSAGRFRVPDLGVGSYEVQASQAGFSTVVHRGITLTVGAQSVVDFALPVGQQQQTVTVEGEVSQVETTNATVGALVTQQQMVELPLNGRNFEQLIQLAPGVQTVTSFTPSGFQGRANEYSVAGARPEGQAILLDDENLQNYWNKGMGSITGSSLGVEAIGEFQTLTNTFSAQFGGNGAVINAVSKSGSNAFHGSAYDFLRNSALDSRAFFDPGSGPPAFRKNQFGGSLGGPVKKDKAFFFVNYEGIQQLLGETKVAFVPDAAHRSIASTVTDPVTAQALASTIALYPLPDPGTVNASTGIGTSTQVSNQTAHENYVLGRFDYTFSASDSMFFRYISDKADLFEPFSGSLIPLWPEQDASHTQYATLEERRIVSPTVVNVARFSFSRPVNNAYTANSVPALQFFPGSGRQDGIVNITGLSAIGSNTLMPFTLNQTRYTEGDDLLWTLGAHSLRFGVAMSRLQSNTYYPLRSGGSWTFQSLTQFRAGQAFTFQGPQNLPGLYPHRDFRELEFTPYFQDDWKVTPKLTLNLGLRWEFVTNPVDAHDELYAVTYIPTAAGFTHVPHVFRNNPTWGNFDPRFGFAYDPFADHKTSIRGGFGIFHDTILPPNYGGNFWGAPPWNTTQQTSPLYPTPFVGTVSPGLPTDPSGFDYNTNTTPYMIQYNLTVQREIAANTVVSLGYIGSHGVHLLTQIEQNPTLATIDSSGVYQFSRTRVNPNLSVFTDFAPIASSRYNSLQATLNRRFTRNVTAQVAYTYSRCTDNGSFWGSYNTNTAATVENPYDLSYDRGVCFFDITHALRVNGLVALPFHGNRLVEGWQLSGIVSANTGLPFNISNGIDQVGYQNSGVSRPDYVSGCQVSVGQINEWFNPACFSLEPFGTLGNTGRNTGRGPNFVNADFAVLKDTKITEAIGLQFRAEFFNILNHPNFGLPASAVFTSSGRNSTAGKITSVVGTARQIQFALKLIF
jgi:Carboxypeptidase regulatory-like domain